MIGVAPLWIALAVYDRPTSGDRRTMRTELVPYAAVVRISVCGTASDNQQIGFNMDAAPPAIGAGEPERWLHAAASQEPPGHET